MAKVVKVIETTESPKEEFEKVEVKRGGFSLKFKFSKKHALILIAVILVMLLPTAYFYNQYQSAKNLLQNPKEQTSVQTKSLVDAVRKLMELPSGETPRVATVTDVTQLSGQAFFARAKNGDKVLIFTQAGKAILYRESENKIIDVSPVNTSVNGNVPSQTNATSPTPGVSEVPRELTATVLNGTAISGLAKSAQTKIQTDMSNVTVSTGDAVNGGYASTIVVDFSGKNTEGANALAKLLSGKVQTQMPSGEKTPVTDILIILGADYAK